MRLIVSSFLVIFVISLARVVYAQGGSEGKMANAMKNKEKKKSAGEIQRLKRIEVRARRLEEEDEKDVSGFVSSIDLQGRRSGGMGLVDILRENAGLNVRQAGGSGSWATLSIRGSTSQQVQIFIDGIPLNDGYHSIVNLSDLPLDALKKVEIYRGVVPAHLGGAIGGAIQLLTRYPRGFRRTSFSTSFGSFRSVRLNAYHGQRSGRWHWTFFGTYRQSAGDFRYFDDRGTPLNFSDDIQEALRQNNKSYSASLLLKTRYRPHRSLSFQLSDLFTFRHQGVPGIGIDRSLSSHYRYLRNLLQFSSDKRHLFNAMLRWKNQLYLVNHFDSFADPKGEIGLGRQLTHNVMTTMGAKTLLLWMPHFEHEISFSSALRFENYRPQDDYNPRLDTSERQRWLWTNALQYIATLFEERLMLTAAIRGEMLLPSYRALESSRTKGAAGEVHWQPTGRLGLKFRPFRPFWFKANVGYYVRYPSFLELFGGNGTTKGNPHLRSETGVMLDVGGGAQLLRMWGFLDLLRFDYAFFTTSTSDIIRFIQNSQGTMIAVNIAAAQVTGQELRLRSEWLGLLRVQFNFTWMNALNLSKASFEHGKQLPGRPPSELSLQIELFQCWGKFFYSYHFASGNFLDRANLQELPPRHLHSLGFILRPALLLKKLGHLVPWTGLSLTFEIKNLLNTRVEQVALQPPLPNIRTIPRALVDFIGYPLEGRSFYLTVNWEF